MQLIFQIYHAVANGYHIISTCDEFARHSQKVKKMKIYLKFSSIITFTGHSSRVLIAHC